MDEYSTLETDLRGSVATIRLNRPERLNALSLEMPGQLLQVLQALARDSKVGAVVLTGSGRGFCSGADLELFDQINSAESVGGYIQEVYRPLILALFNLSKPVIGAINGVAAGAGFALALACDFRIMSDQASMSCAFIRIGLVPDAGTCWFLTRIVGYSRALEIATSGRMLDARECLSLGLADQIVGAEQLYEAAAGMAYKLASSPQPAGRLTKRLLAGGLTLDLEQVIREEAKAQAKAIESADHREGIQAFREKRAPRFGD